MAGEYAQKLRDLAFEETPWFRPSSRSTMSVLIIQDLALEETPWFRSSSRSTMPILIIRDIALEECYGTGEEQNEGSRGFKKRGSR